MSHKEKLSMYIQFSPCRFPSLKQPFRTGQGCPWHRYFSARKCWKELSNRATEQSHSNAASTLSIFLFLSCTIVSVSKGIICFSFSAHLELASLQWFQCIVSPACLQCIMRIQPTWHSIQHDSKNLSETVSRFDIIFLGCVYLPLEKGLESGNLMIERNMLNCFILLCFNFHLWKLNLKRQQDFVPFLTVNFLCQRVARGKAFSLPEICH